VTTKYVFPQVFVSQFRQKLGTNLLGVYFMLRYMTLTVGGVCKEAVIPRCRVCLL